MIVEGPNGLRVEFPDGTDAATINKVMSEAHARRTAVAKPAGPQKIEQVQAEKSGFDNFVNGLDRLPNLVGMGRMGIMGDQSTGNKTGDQARSDFGGGAAQAFQASGRAATNLLGPVDDAVIAGISEMTTNDQENFFQKFDRTQQQAEQLRKDQPLASAVGDVAGFGYGGALLGRASGAIKLPMGLTTKGVGAQSAILAGGHSLLENPTDPGKAAEDAVYSAIFGKALQGIGDAIIKPAADIIVPRVGRALEGGKKVKNAAGEVEMLPNGKPKRVRDTEEFKLSVAQVNRISSRLKLPVAEVRKSVDEYVAANGVDANILAVAGDDTAEAFGKLSRAKKDAAQVFRKGEEDTYNALPDRIGTAVERTGDTRSATGALDDLAARGEAAIGGREAQLADDLARTQAKAATVGRSIDDSAEAAARRTADAARMQSQGIDDTASQQARAATLAGDQTKRMVRDETGALIAGQEAKIDAAGARMSGTLQKRAEGIATDKAVLADLDKQTTATFRGVKDPVTGKYSGGMADKPVELPSGWVKKNFPHDPKTITAVLKAKAETLPQGEALDRLNKAIDSFSAKAGEPGPMTLTLDDVDSLRRALSKPVDVAGVRYNLKDIGRALTKYASEVHPAYKSEYLDVFAATKAGLEARKLGAAATGKNAATGAADLDVAVAQQPGALGRLAVKQGAQDAALQAIAATTKDGAQTLQAANSILRNADAIIKLAGKEGEALVRTVRTTMTNVKKIQQEIADITAAARTTREGIADDVRQQTQRITDDATAAKRDVTERATSAQRKISDQRDTFKRALSDKEAARLLELKRAAKAQLDAIKASMSKNQRAIDAASKVMTMTEAEFGAATAGSQEPLGAVARGAIAGKAAQSPADAVGVIKDLTVPATGRRIAKVAGQETADTLGTVGRTQRAELENLGKAAQRPKDNGPIGEELSLAMEALATATGRPGPGFVTAMVKRGVASLTSFGISGKAAKAIAEAMLNRDAAFVNKMLNRLAKTEGQRKVIAEAIRMWATGSAASSTANVR